MATKNLNVPINEDVYDEVVEQLGVIAKSMNVETPGEAAAVILEHEVLHSDDEEEAIA